MLRLLFAVSLLAPMVSKGVRLQLPPSAKEDQYDDEAIGLEPEFDVAVTNVTTVVGQAIILPCTIDNLGKYKVAWLDNDFIPLTYEDRRVVDDSRFSVVRPGVRQWHLQILDTLLEDEGSYRCTTNTSPIRSKMVFLHIHVPAQILDHLSSQGEVVVQEWSSTELACIVAGVPPPEVTWYRRYPPITADNVALGATKSCRLTDSKSSSTTKGELLTIQNVSRHCDDVYVCVAENGVQSLSSMEIKLTVQFPPELRLPNPRISQARGRETILECVIAACPHAVNHWEKEGRRIASSSPSLAASLRAPKYRIEAYSSAEEGAGGGEGAHVVTLSLRIHIGGAEDYGAYKCVAANELGRAEAVMYLHEYTDHESRAEPVSFVTPAMLQSSPTLMLRSVHSTPRSGQRLHGLDLQRGISNSSRRLHLDTNNKRLEHESAAEQHSAGVNRSLHRLTLILVLGCRIKQSHFNA